MFVGVDLISRRHALLKWCSHEEEIYLLTVMPPSTLCFQGSRVWLATIVTNTDLHPFQAWPPTYFPPLSAVCCGGWVGSGGACKPLCMHVGYMHRSGGVLRGFHCKSSRVQNTLMDPNKTPFQSRLSNNNVWGWKRTQWPFFAAQKWAANFSLPNIMLACPQYEYIKGTQNTENAWIINATYTGQEEGSFNKPTQ